MTPFQVPLGLPLENILIEKQKFDVFKKEKTSWKFNMFLI